MASSQVQGSWAESSRVVPFNATRVALLAGKHTKAKMHPTNNHKVRWTKVGTGMFGRALLEFTHD